MNKKKTYQALSIFLGLIVAMAVFVYIKGFINTPNLEKITQEGIANFEIGDDPASESPEGRWQYERDMLKDPVTGNIPPGMRKREMDYTLNVLLNSSSNEPPGVASLGSESADGAENSSFQSYGPYNVGGRTRALALDVTDENIIIAGGISGGIWRSTNGGTTWAKTTSPRDFPPVSSILQDRRPGHTSDWYFGGGEFFGNSASAPSAFYFGDGIYKSTDGGLSWNVIPATEQGNNVDFVSFSVVNELAIDESNTAVAELYVAGPSRIFRTTDNFTRSTTVLGGANEGVNYTDVVVSPTGVVYAVIATSDDNGAGAEEGVFISLDGITWTSIDPPTGLPNTYNRAELALDPNDENTLYLVGGSQVGSTISDFLFRYNRTTSAWVNLSDNMGSSNDIGEGHHFQQGYNLYVSVHPSQGNTVFTGGTNLLRSTDGFQSATNRDQIGGYQPDNNPNSFGSYTGHHPDQHGAVYLPSDANVMITGTDGGLYRTDNNLQSASGANPVSWQSLNNGYQTTQFYAIDMLRNARGDMRIPGGMQDNGSWINYTNDAAGDWTQELRGDGAFAAITHNSLYLSGQEGQVRRYRLTASNEFDQLANIQPSGDLSEFLFINPFMVDPVHREKLFIAAKSRVYYTRDITTNPGIGEWQSITAEGLESETVSALAASIQPEGVLYFGTRNGSIYKVNDTRVEETAVAITGVDMPDGATVSSISVDPANANRVFLTFSNYNVVSIWMSENGGESWTSISGNMEENTNGTGAGPSIRWIELLPDVSDGNLYFVATSVGLFMTQNVDGDNTVWAAQSENLIGRNLTNMIKVRPVDGQVAVSTHGNGVFVGNYEVLNSPTINYSIIVPDEEMLLRGPTSSVSGAGFTYQWLKDGAIIADATAAEYTATDPGTYKLRLTDEIDNTVSESNELIFVLDGLAPIIETSSRLNPIERETSLTEVIFEITFNEPVSNVDATDFVAEGAVTGRVTNVNTITAGRVFHLTMSDLGGAGRLRLGVATDTDIQDAAENVFLGEIQTNQSYTVTDVSAPSVSITRLDPLEATTNRTEVSFRVRFSEVVANVDMSDFELSANSIASASITSVTEDGDAGIYRVEISGITEDGVIDLNLIANNEIEDLTGLPFSGEITMEETFTIENVLITSIDNGKGASQVKVFGNPSNGMFRVVLSDAYLGGFSMKVIDSNGKQLLTRSSDNYQSGTELTIDLRNQPDGVFLLNVSNGQRKDVVKLLKRSN